MGAGSLYLDNQDMAKIAQQLSSAGDSAQSDLYELYQKLYILSVSSRYRGGSADSFKSYLSSGPINVVTEMLDVVSDLTLMAQALEQGFKAYESDAAGRVDQTLIGTIKGDANGERGKLEQEKGALDGALSRAGQYIAVSPMNYDDISGDYDATAKALDTIKDDLSTCDSDAATAVDQVRERIAKLKAMVDGIAATCYQGGTWDPSKAADLTKQSWYHQAGNVTLQMMMREDPFAYAAGEVSVDEDQWTWGLCKDVYAYAGYKMFTASGEAGANGHSMFAKGQFAAYEANFHAQASKYATFDAMSKGDYASVDYKAGIDDGYIGRHLKAEAGVLHAEGALKVGTDQFNGHVSGEADLLEADGKAAFEFQDDGEFAIGAMGHATAAEAKADIRISGWKFKESNDGKHIGKKENNELLSLGVSPHIGASVGGGAYIESKKAIETDYFNINATTVSVDLTVFVGIKADITVPTFHLKVPW